MVQVIYTTQSWYILLSDDYVCMNHVSKTTLAYNLYIYIYIYIYILKVRSCYSYMLHK